MLEVPHTRQSTNYSCGPACLISVLSYYGQRLTEAWVIRATHCTPESGTNPAGMVRFIRSRRHRVKVGQRLNITTLHDHTASGWPVIVAYQDWPHRPSETDLSRTFDNGHYAVVCGVEGNRVYLMDPSSPRYRRSIDVNKFMGRWRDIEGNGNVYTRWGLAVGPRYKDSSHALP